MQIHRLLSCAAILLALIRPTSAQTRITTIDRAAAFSADATMVAVATDDLKIEIAAEPVAAEAAAS